jgi:alanyl-tRNA synthetase
MRAVGRARADYEGLTRVAQTLSTSLEDAPQVASAQLEAVRETDRSRRKLEAELSRYQGRELYDATTPDANGVRRVLKRLPKGTMEEVRALAQSFTAQPKAVFAGAIEQPASVLLAVSADAGIDAGKTLQPLLAQAGGRGGGNARLAQGSVPAKEALEQVISQLLKL